MHVLTHAHTRTCTCGVHTHACGRSLVCAPPHTCMCLHVHICVPMPCACGFLSCVINRTHACTYAYTHVPLWRARVQFLSCALSHKHWPLGSTPSLMAHIQRHCDCGQECALAHIEEARSLCAVDFLSCAFNYTHVVMHVLTHMHAHTCPCGMHTTRVDVLSCALSRRHACIVLTHTHVCLYDMRVWSVSCVRSTALVHVLTHAHTRSL